jgi:hypothetical protein
MKKIMVKITSALLIGLFLTVQLSFAQGRKEVSLAQASENIRNDTKGKILSAKTTEINGRRTHKIQVLTPSGRVKVYRIPVGGQNHSERKPVPQRIVVPPNQDYQQTPININRSKLRDRPAHNSRLNTTYQNINPRSRTQVNNPSVAREKSDNK